MCIDLAGSNFARGCGVAELSATMEDYLEAIYRLEMQRGTVRVKDIAAAMAVKMPSVTSALQTLAEQGVISYTPYRPVEFTPEGRRIAKGVYNRHQALCEFLTDILQLDAKTAEGEACRMEHSVGSETLMRLLTLIDFIKRCPRGGDDWLKHLKGRWEQGPCTDDCKSCIGSIQIPESAPFSPPAADTPLITLNMLEPGKRGVIVKLCGHGALRRRIMDMGITPGSDLEVERLAPLGDPMEFKIRGYHLSLRNEEAAKIHVRPTS